MPDETTLEDAWRAEIREIIAEADAGRVTYSSWDEVRARVFGRIPRQ